MASKNVIRQDVVQIGFEVDQSPLNQLERSLEDVGSGARDMAQYADRAAENISQIGSETADVARASDRLRDNGFQDLSADAENASENAQRFSTEVTNAASNTNLLRDNGFQDVEADARSATEEVEQFREEVTEGSRTSGEAISDLTGGVGDLTKAFAGVAAAFAVNQIVQGAAEIEQSMKKLEAQTGATEKEMQQYRDSVKEIYTGGMGENIGDVADSLALVNQQFKNLDSGTVKQITNDAIVLRDTFDMDVNETLRGVNALMTNMGLTAEESFDYITKGAQNGLDKSKELSDNIAEYSQLWGQAGFSAQEMFTILQNGLDSGAYNLDKVNDFVKEMAISLSDGRVEKSIDSFSEKTQSLFQAWQTGGASQRDVIMSIISDLSTMENQQEALTLASNTWSALGEDNAMAIITSLNAVNDTYGDVKGTMESINDVRYDDIGSSLDRLSRSGSTLMNETLNPLLAGVNNILSDGLDAVSEFAKEHEVLAKSISAAALTATALAVGVGAVVAAAHFVPPVIAKITASLSAMNIALGPIGIALTAVSVGVGILTAVFSDQEEEIEDYNGTLEECREELELTTDAHRKAVNRYGENSKAAKALEKDMDKLSAQYEKGGGRLGELNQKIEKTSETYKELSKSQKEAMDGIESSNTKGFQAVSMLEALSSKAEITSVDLDTMAQYADYLNDTFHTNIVVDYDTGELTGFNPDDIVKQIISVANDNKIKAATNYLSSTEFVDNYTNAVKEYQNAQSELLIAAQMVENKHYARTNKDMVELQDNYDQAAKAVEEAEKNLNSLDDELRTNANVIDKSGKMADAYKESLQNAAKGGDAYLSFAQDTTDATDDVAQGFAGAQEAVSSYNDKLYNLAAAYDEALLAAQESVAGQYSAWDEVGEIANTSIGELQSALQSQSDYWADYASNLQLLQEKAQSVEGLSDMLATMSDGSEDSAAAIAALAGASNEELASVVSDWQAVKDKQGEASQSMADTQTQFSEKASQMGTDMEALVGKMDMSTEAQTNANKTINSFIDGLLNGISTRKGEVDAAIQSLMAAADTSGITVTKPVSVEGNAVGTTNSADTFIAGEKGAELIVGHKGSTVFPAAETQKIVDAVQDYSGGNTPNFSGNYAPDFTGNYTPEKTSVEKVSNNVQNVTYAPNFTLNMNGASATDDNKRKVKRWVKESVNEALSNMSTAFKPVIEI